MNKKFYRNKKIAIVIPCYNEEIALPLVIRDCQNFLPEGNIHVFDNDSTDRTAELAGKMGVFVHHVRLKGKGNAVKRMFADIEADIFLMVDGDATYDLSLAKTLIDTLIDDELDMVIGKREEVGEKNYLTYRKGHRFGNLMLTKSISNIFGGEFSDMLSGYRVFTRRFVKSFPSSSSGFEIETELTVHTLELRMKYKEIATPYIARPSGSVSKLSTYKDGLKILITVVKLYASERPFLFYGILSVLFVLLGLGIFAPVLVAYLETGLVQRFPTAILALGLILIGFYLFFSGLILQKIKLCRNELKFLAYLSTVTPSK